MPTLEVRISLNDTNIPDLIKKALKEQAPDWLPLPDFYIPLFSFPNANEKTLQIVEKNLEAMLYGNMPFILTITGKVIYSTSYPCMAKLELNPEQNLELMQLAMMLCLSREVGEPYNSTNIPYCPSMPFLQIAIFLNELSNEHCRVLQKAIDSIKPKIEVPIRHIDFKWGNEKCRFTVPKTQLINHTPKSTEKNDDLFQRIPPNSPTPKTPIKPIPLNWGDSEEQTAPLYSPMKSPTKSYTNGKFPKEEVERKILKDLPSPAQKITQSPKPYLSPQKELEIHHETPIVKFSIRETFKTPSMQNILSKGLLKNPGPQSSPSTPQKANGVHLQFKTPPGNKTSGNKSPAKTSIVNNIHEIPSANKPSGKTPRGSSSGKNRN